MLEGRGASISIKQQMTKGFFRDLAEVFEGLSREDVPAITDSLGFLDQHELELLRNELYSEYVAVKEFYPGPAELKYRTWTYSPEGLAKQRAAVARRERKRKQAYQDRMAHERSKTE